MLKSNFNFVRELKNQSNGYTLYNSRTGCLSLLDAEHYHQFKNFPDIPIDDATFFSQLIDCGYIVNSLEDEYSQIRHRMYQAKFSSNTLSITIAPTMSCNFNCTYCYEKNQLYNSFMSTEIQDAIINYIETYADTIRNLKVQWYGGEPLLATKVISHINDHILSLCLKNKIQYNEEIITNGYLLDENHIEFLNRNHIQTIQITIDGKKSTHDSRRVHKDGFGTYQQIIHNLKLCKLHFTGQIDLRVNVDKNNINEIDELVEELKNEELFEFVNLYLGRISDTNNTICDSSCLSCKCFALENVHFYKTNNMLRNYLKTTYPYPIGNNCAADYNLSLIIAPNGDLYKCHMAIGQSEHRIGNILDLDQIDISKIEKTLLWDPTKDSICGPCKYLPICMGGCSKDRTETSRSCDYRKYILDSYLEDISYIRSTQRKEDNSYAGTCSEN